jgi:hypothetical protein
MLAAAGFLPYQPIMSGLMNLQFRLKMLSLEMNSVTATTKKSAERRKLHAMAPSSAISSAWPGSRLC